MNESNESWYVANADGSARGPFSRFQLLAMRQAGEIGDEHLLWTLALSEWIPLKRALGGGNAAAASAQQNYVAPPPKPADAPGAPKPKNKAEQRARASDKPAPKPPAANAQASMAALLRARADAEAAESQARLNEVRGAMAAQTAQVGIAGRRLLARSLDTLLLGGLGWVLLSYLGADLGLWYLSSPSYEFSSSPLLAWPLLILAALVLESVLLGMSGYTPGKALLGMRVLSSSGRVMGLPVAFQRGFAVLLRGQALLIPPFTLIAYGLALAHLQKHGRTSWDLASDLTVSASPIDSYRWWLAMAALPLGWLALIDGWWMRLLA